MNSLVAFSARIRGAIQRNPSVALAITLIVVSVLGYFGLLVAVIIPSLTSESSLTAQLSDGRRVLAGRQKTEAALPADAATRVADAQATLAGELGVFATEAQVSQVIDALYQNARASGVNVGDLQSQSKAGSNALYQIVTIKVQAQGTSHQVLDFASRINQISANPVVVNTLAVQGGDAASTLTLEFSLYTSPFADSVPSSSDQPATVVPAEAQPGAQTSTPDASAATPAPSATVTATPTSTPTATAVSTPTSSARPGYFQYVVRRGDTLYSIARRYGTTVKVLMAANGMASPAIKVGQSLYIPVR
jgi:LysM repeat protein